MLPVDNTNELRNLLQKLSQNIQSIESRQREEILDYNVFYSTGIWEKEVIICNLLWDLLSPQGSHELDILFLDLFNQTVLKNDNRMLPDEIKTARVYREAYTDGRRRIDLTIETYKRFIPIEVKINANDLPKQCIDYYEYVAKKSAAKELKRPVLYYLTTDGRSPSADSMGGLQTNENLILISFKKDILAWIDLCLKHPKVNSRTYTKCILNQFREIIIGEGRTMKQMIQDDSWEVLFNCVRNLNEQEKVLAARIWVSLDQHISCISLDKNKNTLLLWKKFIEHFERKMFDNDIHKLSHDKLPYNNRNNEGIHHEYWYKQNKTINDRNVDVGLFLFPCQEGTYIGYRIHKDDDKLIVFCQNDAESIEDYRELFPNSLTLQLPLNNKWSWIHCEKFPQLNNSDINFYNFSDKTLLLMFDEYLDDYLDNCFIPRIREITGW